MKEYILKKASNDGVEIAKEIGKGIAFMPFAFILNPDQF